ncbi:MAG: ABC transporter ATP-binding protein [Desulfobacterales bacterium]|nr:MAG: ABC transporter ATP-binding protein [Desulfobacterales bacterium]
MAVDSVDLVFDSGTAVGIIGPNGSGKTTLFNLITGYHKSDAGTIIYKDRDITGLKPFQVARIGIGRTFQIPIPFSKMTLLENMLVPHMAESIKNIKKRAEELLELFYLDHLSAELAENLSGGQLKLLEIARTLMRDPDTILFDECVAGVNPTIRAEIMGHLKHLRERGKTLILIEHDMEWISEISEKVVVMDFGRVIAQGTFSEIYSDQRVREAYLGR